MADQNILGHDVNGNPIYENSAPATKNATPPVATQPVNNSSGNFMSGILPMLAAAPGTEIGATLGSPLGPLGSLAGGALGGGLSYLLAKKGADYITSDKDPATLSKQDLMEALTNQAFESGIPLVGKGLKGISNFLGDHPLIRSLLKMAPSQISDVKGPGSTVSDLQALKATPQLNRSLGDFTGSTPLQNIESRTGKQALVDLRATQKIEQQAILDKLRGTQSTPETIGKTGQIALGNAFADSKASYQDLYNQFDQKVAIPNTENIQYVTGREPDIPSTIIDPSTNQPLPATPGKPIVETRQVQLPIHLGTTAGFIAAKSEALNKLLSPDDFENLSPYLQRSYNAVKSVMKDAAAPTEIMLPDGSTQSVPIKAYDAVKEARTQLGELASKATGQKKALFLGLSDAMDQDITKNLNARDPSGAANNLRDQANTAYGVHKDIYDPVMKRIYGNDASLKQYTDPSEMFASADTDPAVARRLRAAFKPQDLSVLKTGMMSQAIDGAYDPASGLTNIDFLINKITSPDSPYKSIFTPSELTNTETMLRGMRTQNPGKLQTGRNLSLAAGHIALTLGGAGAGAMLGKDEGSRIAGATAGALAINILPSVFVSRVLLNPNTARIAAQLPKIAADSPQAQLMVRTLLKGALRGAQVSVNTPDKGEQQAHIDSNGRISLDQ